MTKKLMPIGFANADGGSGRVAEIVRNTIFKDYPTIDVPMNVQARLDTNDACIEEAVRVFKGCGAGFKNSTASNDPRIKIKGWKSANIKMRPLCNAYALARILYAPGAYGHICGTLRYARGSFYDEQRCEIALIDGQETAVITQHLNIELLRPFAELALELSRRHNLHPILSSKSTIAQSELLFRNKIETVWKEYGLIENQSKEKDGIGWDKTYSHILTDLAIASLPIHTAEDVGWKRGAFLHVADNANGDTSSDVIEYQGGRLMGSQVYCIDPDGSKFMYEELPGGTADQMETGPLHGKTFYDPVAIIFALANAFESVNPSERAFFDAVRRETLIYIKNPEMERDTHMMIEYIAERVMSVVV